VQAHIAGTVEELSHAPLIELPEGMVTVPRQGSMLVGVFIESNVVQVCHEGAGEMGRQLYLGNSLSINAPGDGSLAVVPQKDMENNLAIAYIPVVAMRYPARGEAMHLDITSPALPSSKLNNRLLEIRPGVCVPAPWRMDHHILAIHGA
jgi:hypothetical protein